MCFCVTMLLDWDETKREERCRMNFCHGFNAMGLSDMHHAVHHISWSACVKLNAPLPGKPQSSGLRQRYAQFPGFWIKGELLTRRRYRKSISSREGVVKYFRMGFPRHTRQDRDASASCAKLKSGTSKNESGLSTPGLPNIAA